MTIDIAILNMGAKRHHWLETLVQSQTYQVREAQNRQELFTKIYQRVPSIIILTLTVRRKSDEIVKILQELQQDFPDKPVIIISDYAIDKADLQLHGYRFFVKPIQSEMLCQTIHQAIYESNQNHMSLSVSCQFWNFDNYWCGDSLAIKDFNFALSQAAKNNSRVLLSGAVGTGKVEAALQLYQQAVENPVPLRLVHCAVTEPKAFEQELFGLENQPRQIQKIGMLESSYGGFLILENIEAMPIAIQKKMARLLQKGSFTRIGGREPISLNSRIIATTGIDIEDNLNQDIIYQDFYDRINMLHINLPSLAERRSDMVTLIDFLNGEQAQKYGMKKLHMDDEAIKILESHNWQGNIFELRNFIERLYLTDSYPHIKIVDADIINARLYHDNFTDEVYSLNGLFLQKLRKAKENFEKYYLHYQLQHHSGNISQTARMIGIDRASLHRKIKELNVTLK